MVERRLLAGNHIIAVALLACVAGDAAPGQATEVDLSGAWDVSLVLLLDPSGLLLVIPAIWIIRQNGVDLDIEMSAAPIYANADPTLEGRIDMATCQLDATGAGECSADTMTATASVDGNSFSGTYTIVTMSPQQYCPWDSIPALLSASRSHCGDGVLDSGEECDDGNNLHGDCCSPFCDFEEDGSPCEDDGNFCTTDRCDGQGACVHPAVSNGVPCEDDGNRCTADHCDGQGLCIHPNLLNGSRCEDDGNFCTLDRCDGQGTCTHPNFDGRRCDDGDPCTDSQCSGGVCTARGPTNCEDGDPCTRESCIPAVGCFSSPEPADSCEEAFGKGLLLVKENTAGRQKVVARFQEGPPLSQADFGDPLFGSTEYTLCLYDGSGSFVESLNVDRAGDTCGSRQCWRSIGGYGPDGRGFMYRDRDLTSDGVQIVKLKAGEAGRTQALVKARNISGAMPTGIAAGLAGKTAIMQLHASDAVCLSMALNDVKRADGTFFKARK